MKKRLISLLLCFVMIMSMIPTSAIAVGEGEKFKSTPTSLAAESSSPKVPKTISGWVELEKTEYILPVGADEAAVKELLTLPETLTAQVQYVTVEEVTVEATAPTEETTPPAEEMTDDTASSQQAEQDTSPADTEPQESKKTADAPPAPAVKPVEKLIVEEIQVPVTWESDKAFSTDRADSFIYTAVLADKDSFVLAEDVEMPFITVQVVGVRTMLFSAERQVTANDTVWEDGDYVADVTSDPIPLKNSIAVRGTVNLSINGNNWLQNNNKTTITVEAGGVLTLKSGTLLINDGGYPNYEMGLIVRPGGKLILDGGELKLNGDEVHIENQGTLELRQTGIAANRTYAGSVKSTGSVVVTGGTHNAAFEITGGTMTINGGTVRCDNPGSNNSRDQSILVSGTGHLIMNNGSQVTKEYNQCAIKVSGPDAKLTINSGAIVTAGDASQTAIVGDNVTSGNISIDPGAAITGKQQLPQTVECTYKDLSGQLQTVAATPLSSKEEREDLRDGWYVIEGAVSLATLRIYGNVNLILADGCTLTANKIEICEEIGKNYSLTVWGGELGTGKAVVNRDQSIALELCYGSSMTINGGNINVTSSGNQSVYLKSANLIVNNGTLQSTCAGQGYCIFASGNERVPAKLQIGKNGTVTANRIHAQELQLAGNLIGDGPFVVEKLYDETGTEIGISADNIMVPSLTYTGKDQMKSLKDGLKIEVKLKDKTFLPSKQMDHVENSDGTEATELINAGKYILVYTGNDSSQSEIRKEFQVNPAGITGTLAQSNELVYKNGEALTPSASGLTAVNAQPITIQYSMDENGTYGEMPTFTENGTYTVYYKATVDNHNPKEGSFTVTVKRSATEFTGGIKTYNGTEETTTFTYGDTITVKAKPTATGIAPAQAGGRMRSLFSLFSTAPAANQMALFINDIQVSEAVNAGSDGYYVMTLTTTDPTVRAQLKPGQTTEVTAKYVGNKNMADTTGTISLTVNKAPQAAPAVVIDYATETLNTTDKMQWAEKNGTSWSDCSTQMAVSAFGWNETEAKVIKLRLKETKNNQPGEVQELTIPARPDAPVAPIATDENITDTSITLNTVKGAEYQKADEGWGNKTEFTGLNANTGYTFKQRLKATETSFASAESTATITTKSISKYTVKHLQQNISDDGYTEVEAQELFGITDAQTAAVAKNYEGFTAQAITQQNIAADGSTVVEVKYDRKVYDITWSIDGTTETTQVRHGATPTHDAPTKASDAQYAYTFKEWSPAITAATGNAAYTAVFNKTVNKYTVKFVNEGGEVLQTEELAYGATPVYKGETPAKEATAEYSYTFKGWDKELAKVTGEVTYTAVYTPVKRSYTITWQNEDGTTIDTTTVEYGTMPTHADPAKDSTAQYNYTFAGWTPELVSVVGEATYKSAFNSTVRSYEVKFVDWNDTVLKTETVKYGSAATAPENPARTGYTFNGWDKAFDSITGATTVKARYTINQYTLTFDSKGGSTINPIEQDYNSSVTAPAEPDKVGYTFGGWYEQEDLSGSAYVFGTMPAGSKTLYAKWNLAAPAAPVIQADPAHGTSAYPNAVTLSVQFTEIPGLTYTYQWYKGEAEVGTGKSMTLDTTAASGEYTVTVMVTDNAETKTSPKSTAKTVAIDKAVITGTITQNGILTYNGGEQTAEITNTLTAKGGQTVIVKFGTAADSCNADVVPVFTGAGTHTVYYKAAAPDHVDKTGSFEVEIQQKEITVTVKDQKITYAEQPDILTGMDQVTVTGLQGSDKLTGITLTANTDFTQLVASAALIANGDTDVVRNYKITYIPGTLTRVHAWDAPTYTWEQKDGSWTCTAVRCDRNNTAVKEIDKANVTGAQSVAPTCTEMGKTTYTAIFTETWAAEQSKSVTDIAATGHKWGKPVITFAEDGKTATAVVTCENNGNHTESPNAVVTSQVKTTPTCETKGTTTYTATVEFDNKVYTATKDVEDIAATGHKWGEPVFTFSQDGKTATAVVTCENDKTHTKALEGVTVTEEITTPATCTLMGTTTYTAKVTLNGTEYTETTTRQDVAIDPSNHNNQITKVDAKVATCTESGSKEHYKCAGCGKLYSDAEGTVETTLDKVTIQATGHKWGEPVITFAEDGKTATAVVTCTVDGNHHENLEAVVTSQVKTPSTCEAKGMTSYTATVEFNHNVYTAIKDVEDIAATGHNWGEPVITFAEDGKTATALVTCENDGNHTETPKAIVTSQAKTAPTCETKGTTTYTATVDFNNKVYTATKDVEDIGAIGHKWGEPVITFAEDGKTATAVVTCENDNSHTESLMAVVTSQVKTAPTCETKGTTTYTATVEFNDKVYTATKDVEDIAATDHKWGKPVITFAEDGKTATAVVTCENDKTHTQKLDAKVTSQVKTPATKETMGITTYMASVEFAGKIYSVSKDMQDIPKVKPAETVEKVETQQLTKVPESLKDTSYNTVAKIEKAMEKVVLQKIGEQNTGNEQKTIIYDAVLMITENGVTRPATKEEVEARGGITIVIPYPAGTNRKDFVFTVAHMLTIDMAGMRAGDIEMPQITLTDAGLKVTLKGLSPVMVGYSKKAAPTEPNVPETTVPETTVPETTVPETTVPETTVPAKPNTPQTGDEAPMMLWFLLGLVSACGVTVTALLRKKKGSVR